MPDLIGYLSDHDDVRHRITKYIVCFLDFRRRAVPG